MVLNIQCLILFFFYINEGDKLISVRLFHGEKLIWIPKTQYLDGHLSIYNFIDPAEINMENLRLKARALSYGGLQCLYYRVPRTPLECMVLLTSDEAIKVMKEHAINNGNKIDVYLKHNFEIDDEQACGQNKDNESNDVGDYNDELDDLDFVDSEYSMSDQDDRLFSKNVDDEIGRDDSGQDDEDYHAFDSDDLESLPENDDVLEIEKDKEKNHFYVQRL